MNGASISNHFHIFLRTERNKYYKHNIKARVNPNKYLSLIIDGMDQAKHNLPHFTKGKINATCTCIKYNIGMFPNFESSSYKVVIAKKIDIE